MKININYELMQEIDIANKGYSLNKCLIKNTKYCLKWALFWSALNMIFSKNHNLNILENTSFMLMLCPLFVGLDFAVLPIHKEYKIQDADHNLRKLVSELNILNVKTSVSLLKDAEVQETHYDIVLNDKNIPVLKQDKYILVLTFDNYGRQDVECLHQEHIIGSKDYDISVGKPQKRLKLSLNGAL